MSIFSTVVLWICLKNGKGKSIRFWTELFLKKSHLRRNCTIRVQAIEFGISTSGTVRYVICKEHSRLRRAAYAACANIASYALGYLPLHWAVEFLSR